MTGTKSIPWNLRTVSYTHLDVYKRQELVDNQVMDKIFVGKVNVMPLEMINEKIEEFRTLQGSELKRAIIAFANETTHVD